MLLCGELEEQLWNRMKRKKEPRKWKEREGGSRGRALKDLQSSLWHFQVPDPALGSTPMENKTLSYVQIVLRSNS
jgi:hypothetical protein